MFHNLKRTLIFICTSITGLILLAMSMAYLLLAQKQLEEKGESAFRSSVNSILYHIGSQTILDHTWLSQVEAEGEMELSIFLNGQPIVYTGMKQQEKQRKVIETAERIAREEFRFDVQTPADSHLPPEPVLFRFQGDGSVLYYGGAAKIPISKGSVGILFVKSREGEQSQLRKQRFLFAGLSLASLFFLFVFSWFFVTRTLRPIEENRKKQMEFVSAASHELRSPLTVIRASLSAAREARSEEAMHFFMAADGECQRMSGLIDDLLLLANADEGGWTMEKEPVEMETLLLTVYENYQKPAYDRKIGLSISLPEKPLQRCSCDAKRIEQVLGILLDNGISYTPSGGHIWLSVWQTGDRIKIQVADNGPGIPDERKTQVFSRFYRAEEARSQRDHYGLGLSIAKEIVGLHKGTIVAEDSREGGAAFIISLPCVLKAGDDRRCFC